MKNRAYFIDEYANMIIVAAVASTLFLGGWYGPLPPSFGVVNLLGKIVAFMFFFMWLRATLPRVRYDQLMKLGWKILIPLALLNVVVTGVVVILLQ
jgi:NADH-quinone oxidoreductase subunit H